MARRKEKDQLALFAFEPEPEPETKGVGAAAQPEQVEALGRELPAGIHLGGSTWSFPGWAGLVYDRAYTTYKLAREGLATDAGALLFQFAPQSLGTPGGFAERLHAFLTALPRGPVYAVELRNRELITADYGDALAAAGACHCHNVHSRMPDVRVQAR